MNKETYETTIRIQFEMISELSEKLEDLQDMIEELRSELRKEKKQNRKLKDDIQYYMDKSEEYICNIMEIGKMLNLESGSMDHIKKQIREKYCSSDKGVKDV